MRTHKRFPPPLAGGGKGEGAVGHWRYPLPLAPSRKGREDIGT
jgi:hypothetical protein